MTSRPRNLHSYTVTAVITLAVFITMLATAPVKAQTKNLAFSINETIAGIQVAFPGTLTIAKGNSDEPLQVSAKIDLSDLFSKANAIVDALGLYRVVNGVLIFTEN